MAEEFSQSILIKVVAQICQMVGFEKIMTTPLVVLADILKEVICKIGRIALRYGEHCGHSTITLRDLSIAFWDCGISPEELAEFLKIVSPLPECITVPKFPVINKNTDDSVDDENAEQVDNAETCSDQMNGGARDSLKIKISLSKIKKANAVKKSKNKKHKKKKKKESKKIKMVESNGSLV